MIEVTVNPKHNNGPAGKLSIEPIVAWLKAAGLEYNTNYGIGWDWSYDVKLQPIINFDRGVDPKIITAFALKWS